MVILQARCPSPLQLYKKPPWELNHIVDTMDIWKCGDFKHFVSLDVLCDLFGIVSPKSGITGADVSKAYHAGRISEIVEYCERDVYASYQVYKKMTGE